ncbi:MAG: hypothetical protein GEV03_02120 [Streptosporangiales bacterium]|nr:hypothetical protein [Streptosporangiales bacterium]
MAADNPIADLDAALTALREQDDQDGFVHALAHGEVVVPQLEPADADLQLPFVEEEGTRYVVAFSSEQRLADSGIDAEDSVALSGSELSAVWPAEGELWLAINPGSDHGVAVSPDTIRAIGRERDVHG